MIVVMMALMSLHAVAAQSPAGRIVTVSAQAPQRFVLALDEVEIDWTAAGGTPARAVTPVEGVREIRYDGRRATLTIAAASESELHAVTRGVESANAGAEVHLVLYEEGEPRSARTRHLLTREVALIVDAGTDLSPLLEQLGAGPAKPVAGVPNAWVVRAKDPLEAIALAEKAAAAAGVRLAYPLLRKQQQLR